MNYLLKAVRAHDVYLTTLGLCPLLVVATTFQTGWAMGMVYLSAIVLVSLFLSIVRKLVPVALQLPAIVLASATMVTLIHAFLQAWFYESSLQLGIYVPLVAMNCLMLGQAEECALRNNVVRSCSQALVAGMGVLATMLALGAVREYAGLSLLQQPSGAFLLLAFVIAGTQWCAARIGHVASVA